jgi:hypothetical protein
VIADTPLIRRRCVTDKSLMRGGSIFVGHACLRLSSSGELLSSRVLTLRDRLTV